MYWASFFMHSKFPCDKYLCTKFYMPYNVENMRVGIVYECIGDEAFSAWMEEIANLVGQVSYFIPLKRRKSRFSGVRSGDLSP